MGGVSDIKGSLYQSGQKLFEKVLNIPNMIHVVWEDTEASNLSGKYGGCEEILLLWLCAGKKRQNELRKTIFLLSRKVLLENQP